MNGHDQPTNGHYLDNAEWRAAIEDALERPDSEPMFNLRDDGTGVYDTVFIGGGAAGRFGSAYMRAMGGRPLVIDRWPFLGGSCPHQACVPHHLFSEAAALLDRSRWFSGELFFPEFDASKASILELVELFRRGRGSAHAFMNWQTQSQLDVEFVLNAEAEIIDRNTVRAAGRTFETQSLVIGLGAYQKPLTCPGAELPGVHDWATLVESLDYEPSSCGLQLEAEVDFLDAGPPGRTDWTLVGCERSRQIHEALYGGDPAELRTMCPREHADEFSDPGVPLLLKCCLREREIELDGPDRAIVPWGASLDEVREALHALARPRVQSAA